MSSLVKLMEKKPLDKITVKDIVDDCDISRNAFYYNYSDIYAVIEELFENELSRLLEKERYAPTWQLVIADICDFLYKYKAAVYSMYRSSKRDFIRSQMQKLIGVCMRQAVRDAAEGLTVSTEDAEAVAKLYAYVAEGFIVEWLDASMKYSVDASVERFSRLFEGDMRRQLERAAEKNSTN